MSLLWPRLLGTEILACQGMSQNPFQPGQTERSPQEQADFLKAIDALPEAGFFQLLRVSRSCIRSVVQTATQVFFTADAVLHVEGNWPELECEGQTRKALGGASYFRWSASLSALQQKFNFVHGSHGRNRSFGYVLLYKRRCRSACQR